MRNRLFSDWRSLLVEATLAHEPDERESPGYVWVHVLVDAARAGADGTPSFRVTASLIAGKNGHKLCPDI